MCLPRPRDGQVVWYSCLILYPLRVPFTFFCVVDTAHEPRSWVRCSVFFGALPSDTIAIGSGHWRRKQHTSPCVCCCSPTEYFFFCRPVVVVPCSGLDTSRCQRQKYSIFYVLHLFSTRKLLVSCVLVFFLLLYGVRSSVACAVWCPK